VTGIKFQVLLRSSTRFLRVLVEYSLWRFIPSQNKVKCWVLSTVYCIVFNTKSKKPSIYTIMDPQATFSNKQIFSHIHCHFTSLWEHLPKGETKGRYMLGASFPFNLLTWGYLANAHDRYPFDNITCYANDKCEPMKHIFGVSSCDLCHQNIFQMLDINILKFYFHVV